MAIIKIESGPSAGGGGNLPPGGVAGDLIVKDSATPNDASWTSFSQYLNDYGYTVPEYASDEAAIAAGLTVGDFYCTAPNHVTLPGGLLKKIQ
jgi:hypothetical protein